VKASKIIFNLSRQNSDVKIERRLFSATTGAIFILKVAWSGSDTGGLHATFRIKISRVVPENKPLNLGVCNSSQTYSISEDCTEAEMRLTFMGGNDKYTKK
jgi:hypothetical protein